MKKTLTIKDFRFLAAQFGVGVKTIAAAEKFADFLLTRGFGHIDRHLLRQA